MLSLTEWPFTGGSVPFFLQFSPFLKCQLSSARCLSYHLIPVTEREAGKDRRVTSRTGFYRAVIEGLAFLGFEQCSSSTLSFLTL